jgi:O-succinylbenzoic acid--CoA ligase
MPRLVAIDLPGGPAFVDELRRAWEAGDAVLPLDQRLPLSGRRSVASELGASLVVSSGGQNSEFPGIPTEPGDALVVATSGTTGVPKGVVLTHKSVMASATATSQRLGVDPARHRWLACLPLCHIGGLAVVTRSLLTETPVSVLPGFDPEAVGARSGAGVFVSLVATALQRVDAELFHTVVLGGSSPPPDLPDNVVTTYGMTETGSGVVYDGVPLDGVEVAIDPRSSEIRVRGPMLLRAYRDGTVPLDPDGWLATGDVGRVGPDGRLAVDGRLTEMIVTGGENVWPTPVESAIRTHPGVAEVAVAGRPDAEWGERVVAWVVPNDLERPPALSELRALVAEQVAPYAAPKELVLVEALPRTSIGKLRKDLLPGPAN